MIEVDSFMYIFANFQVRDIINQNLHERKHLHNIYNIDIYLFVSRNPFSKRSISKASHTDGIKLDNMFGQGYEVKDWSKGFTLECSIQSCNNYSFSFIGHFFTKFNYIRKKLSFVNSNDIIVTLKSMDFLRSYFFKNEPLITCPFLSSKLDSPGIKILERHSLNVKKVSLQSFDYRII